MVMRVANGWVLHMSDLEQRERCCGGLIGLSTTMSVAQEVCWNQEIATLTIGRSGATVFKGVRVRLGCEFWEIALCSSQLETYSRG